MNDQFNLDGKIALVTGGSRGIGESCAKLLAAYGAHVIVTSRKQEELNRVAGEIIAAGGKATARVMHAGNIEQMEATFEWLKAEFGRIDILFNNAATNPHFGPMIETPIRAIDKTIEVNIRGYMVMTQLAAKMMKEQGSGGSIINTASINALKPGHWQGIYSVTKAAVVSMTKCFAMELGPDNIRVNALLPGFTRTKFAGALFEEDTYKNIVKGIPMGRGAEPDEMAGAVLFMASDAAGYMTGQTLVIDGGAVA